MSNPISPPGIFQEAEKVTETIGSLQNIIINNAILLKDLKFKKKDISEMEKNLLDNDVAFTEAVKDAEELNQKIKEARAVVKRTEESMGLKVQKREITQQEKEVQETLSNHLTNYYALTNSKSIDMPDGSEMGFKIKSQFGSKQLSLF